MLLTKLIKPLQEAKGNQHVIYDDDEPPTTCRLPEAIQADIMKLKEVHPRLTVHSFTDFTKLGDAHKFEPTPPPPEDLCCIMYTSGSTGPLKGVMLKHKNVVAAIAGGDEVLGPYLGPGDGCLAYLHLAHIVEYVMESACLYLGVTINYGNPKTISDSSMRNCRGTCPNSNPRVWLVCRPCGRQ